MTLPVLFQQIECELLVVGCSSIYILYVKCLHVVAHCSLLISNFGKLCGANVSNSLSIMFVEFRILNAVRILSDKLNILNTIYFWLEICRTTIIYSHNT